MRAKERLGEILDGLLKEDMFLLTTHIQADPDGIASEVALDYLLRSFEKEVVIVNREPIPSRYRFLDPERRIQDICGIPMEMLEGRMIVSLDTSDPERMGIPSTLIQNDLSNLMVIDHHDGARRLRGNHFQDSEMGSTAEMVYELFEAINLSMPHHVATAIYAGIAMDTGYFRYGKTTPRTHEIAAELLRKKVNPSLVSERLLSNSALEKLHLKKILYNNLTISEDRTIAYFSVYHSDLEKLNLNVSALEGIAGELMEIEAIQMGIIFFERESGYTQIIVRTKRNVDALFAIAKFGGGGHKNACGAMTSLPMADAVSRFLPFARDCIQNTQTMVQNKQ